MKISFKVIAEDMSACVSLKKTVWLKEEKMLSEAVLSVYLH